MRLMRAGDWPTAWRVADGVLAARGGYRDWTLPRHLQPVWDGSALQGRDVLVRCYHGLGDTIQFARYLPVLGAIARTVTVWAQPALLPLLAEVEGVTRWLPLHDGDPGVAYDVDVEVMELAHVFRTTPATIPGAVPYLGVPRRELPRSGDAIAAGIVWQAGDWDAARSVPPDLLGDLLRKRGVAWWSLQRGPARLRRPAGLGCEAGGDAVRETASAMQALDLVISVDSMPAHLAGALGRPVWTLLRHDADWRWMAGGEGTPWYPTMRLFRQPREGDWAPVIAAVSAALDAFRPAAGRSPAA